MEKYEGHTCNKNCQWKYPANCWACKKSWCLECIKDERPELASWTDNYIMVPRADTYMVEGACIQFICPPCIYGKMEKNEKEGNAANEMVNRLFAELSQFRAEFKLSNENMESISAKMDKTNELIEDSKNHTISELAAQFGKNYASANENNGKNINNKRPRLSDDLIDMTEALDLSINISMTESRTINEIQNQLDTITEASSTATGMHSADGIMVGGTVSGISEASDGSSGLIRPFIATEPQQLQTVKPNESAYEVFVSRFHPDESEGRIRQHIASKMPEINGKELQVKKLTSNKMNGSTKPYVSFRISALNEHVYKKLLNPEIWPNATARPYVMNKLKGKNEKASHQIKRDRRKMTGPRMPTFGVSSQAHRRIESERPEIMYQPSGSYQAFQPNFPIPHVHAMYPNIANHPGNRPFLYHEMNSAFPQMFQQVVRD